LLLFVIRIPFVQYEGSLRYAVSFLIWFVPIFLGGLWVARKIESRFALHGFLVGVVANILLFPLSPLMGPTQQSQSKPDIMGLILLITSFIVKMFGGAFGAYIGGRWLKNRPLIQPAQTPDKLKVPENDRENVWPLSSR